MGQVAREEIDKVIRRLVDEYTPGDYVEEWDLDGLWTQLDQIFQVDFDPTRSTRLHRSRGAQAADRDDAHKLYDKREEELGEELMRALERYLLLQIIDRRWREHLYDMDYLREGIHLRGFAQIDPLVAYKNEAFTLFPDLMNTIWSDFARMIYNVEVEVEGAKRRRQRSVQAPPPATPRAEHSGSPAGPSPTSRPRTADGQGVR